MCTAVSYRTKDHYFGRNLDLEYSYREEVTITPRNYPFAFRKAGLLSKHYAMIGLATVADGQPLYYEATNEKGLSMAGLNFPGNAAYLPARDGMENVTPFEFIPYILGQCDCIDQALEKLRYLNLVDLSFSNSLPLTPLHWIITDSNRSVTVEPMSDGLHVYENPLGVLTNNPPFEYHLHNIKNYLNLSVEPAINHFADSIPLTPYSNGMGAIGLPGDHSSASRFVRAAFVKLNSVSADTEEASVSQFFHILGAVEMPRGCVRIHPDIYEITFYSCCCNTDKGIYYYKTYDNSSIIGIDMHREDLNGSKPISYPLTKSMPLMIQN